MRTFATPGGGVVANRLQVEQKFGDSGSPGLWRTVDEVTAAKDVAGFVVFGPPLVRVGRHGGKANQLLESDASINCRRRLPQTGLRARTLSRT